MRSPVVVPRTGVRVNGRIGGWYFVLAIIVAGVGALGFTWGYAQTTHAHRRCAHHLDWLYGSASSPPEAR